MDEQKLINIIKSLSIAQISRAKSGHPGIALGAAPILYTLYTKHMNIDVNDPNWINRDRFVMSAGHGSSLLYSTLYMSGFSISLKTIQTIRFNYTGTP